MKRGTPRHPKLTLLANALGITKYAAAGLLELLWHYAAEFAHDGFVGRHGEDAIASALCWDGASTVLVTALAESGWLERCRCHGLRVHDWPEHADQTVQRVLAKRNQRFLSCYDDPSSMLASSQNETGQPLPLPLPLPSPIAVAVATKPPTASQSEQPLERDELQQVRGQVSAELKRVLDLLGDAGDGQREMRRASLVPGGQCIVSPAACSSLPWLRTTLDRLVTRRLELEEQRSEAKPARCSGESPLERIKRAEREGENARIASGREIHAPATSGAQETGDRQAGAQDRSGGRIQ